MSKSTRAAPGMPGHIETLQRKHEALEGQLHSLQTSLSASDAEIADVKRRKLALKDELAGLQGS